MQNSSQQAITLDELQQVWGFRASQEFISRFNAMDLSYSTPSRQELQDMILQVIRTLEEAIEVVGPHRKMIWELGWTENLEEFKSTKMIKSLTPKYFNKFPVVRWKQGYVQPNSPTMEQDALSLIIHWLLEEYAQGVAGIYEFGCGTGSNLMKIRDYLPNVELYGLDWATSSQELIRMIANDTSDSKLHSANFNYFDPDKEFVIEKNSAVLTVASLEQTGDDFSGFIDYLLAQRPKVVIHIEPMWDSLNPLNLLDYLSIKYMKKRNYLNGLQEYIQVLADNGQINILLNKRSYLGSFYVDGYSVLVWEPVNHK